MSDFQKGDNVRFGAEIQMNNDDKIILAKIFGLSVSEVELIHSESARTNTSFIEVLDSYKVWLQAEALCQPYIHIQSKPKVNIFKRWHLMISKLKKQLYKCYKK
jgi:FAD synthase